MNLPMLGAPEAPLLLENIPALQAEVRALARELGPEQEVALAAAPVQAEGGNRELLCF